MPHYEPLKYRNSHISLRSYNRQSFQSSNDKVDVVNINVFKPIMIALSIILAIALVFAVIKYYSENIRLNVRNFFKKDKEIVEGLSINELSATNLNKGFLNNFDGFKFFIPDDFNTNKKLSVDTADIGSNKYVTTANELYGIENYNNNRESGMLITRESIEPFFNYYADSNSITFVNTNRDTNNIIEENKNISSESNINFSWNNAFSWIKQKNTKTITNFSIDSKLNTSSNTQDYTTNNLLNRDNTYNKEENEEIETEYFETVLKPRENRVIINTMKPAYTPNKYRDEEYIASNNITVEKYESLNYKDSEPKVKKKTKIIKVEDRYTSKENTNKKPVVIENKTDTINKNYNTDYYRPLNNEKNTIIIKDKEEIKSIANNINTRVIKREEIEELKKDIPSKEYRKIVENKVESIKKDNTSIDKKNILAITNSKLQETIAEDNTTLPYRNIEEVINTPIIKYEPQKNNDTIATVIRSEDDKNIITDKQNKIESKNTIEPSIDRYSKDIYNNKNDINNTIEEKIIQKNTGVKKPINKNYIYLASFDEKRSSISLVRKERNFIDNNINTIINTLLNGASDKENSENTFSAISRDTKLLNAFIDEYTLYINLSEEFEYNPLGSEGMLVAIYQIVYTATQFENIDSVVFLVDGKFNETIGSEGYIINKIFKRLSPNENIFSKQNNMPIEKY